MGRVSSSAEFARPAATKSPVAHAVPIHVEGAATRGESDYAHTRIEAVLRYARDPVLFVRAKLTHLADPALSRPAIAEVNVDLNGRLVRAQAARPSMREALDEVHDRLRDRVLRAAGDWEAIRGGRPKPDAGEWRHGAAPTERPPFFPRPDEERQIVRHKAFSLPGMTVDEAAFDMEMLDYGFHLFTEDGSRVDSVLYRTDDEAGYRLAQVDPRPDLVVSGLTRFTVSPQPAPTLTIEEAATRLNASGWTFVFFRDAQTGRGCVLYFRYDGHFGLLVPAG